MIFLYVRHALILNSGFRALLFLLFFEILHNFQDRVNNFLIVPLRATEVTLI